MRRLKEKTDLAVTGALANNIEVNARGVNKGNGLLMLGKILGIEKEEIMACGDGLNDLAMLRAWALESLWLMEMRKSKSMPTMSQEVMTRMAWSKAIEKFVLR